MIKLLTSHEQVPTVMIMRLETGKTTILGVCCMVVTHSYENKAISAGDWLTGAWAELGKNAHQWAKRKC